MLGYVVENVLEGDLETVQWHEIDGLAEGGACMLDVREPKEWEEAHIEGALHIPPDQLRDRLTELPSAATIFLYCHAGLRGYLATRILQEKQL